MKQILLVADVKGWIFERHCKEIQKRLKEYHIDIAYLGDDIKKLAANYDLIYVLDPMPMVYPPAIKTILGLRNERFHLEHPEGPKGVYEKGFADRHLSSIKDKCCVFHVVNRQQLKAFKDIVVDKPLLLVQHGIDEECFNRNRYKRVKNNIFTIGSSGKADSLSNKGFEIITKACDRLGIRHLKSRYADRRLTKSQMPLFYSQVDVYVCMSEFEGLCNPIMEAGAMGIPVISTRCGAAGEMIKDGISGLLIDRNIDALTSALEKMKDETIRKEMGNKFYEEIMLNWTWKVKIADFKKMFELFFTKRVNSGDTIPNYPNVPFLT